MPNEKKQQLIDQGRAFLRIFDLGIDEPTDQQAQKPQPPLVKAKMTETQIDLPHQFAELSLNNDLLDIINRRESRRIYTDAPMSLLQLSYLLWTTQGIKAVRRNNYATQRTVPCGGARHEFETYLAVRKVDGLLPGIYHYLPLTHQIEWLSEVPAWEDQITTALSGQKWAALANVIFFWSVIPYRSEWRYSVYAHRIILVDIGYVGQNLYLACESTGLGTCAVGAFETVVCDRLIGLDGIEEFTILASPVGTVPPIDRTKEVSYHAFQNR